ncbi:MAG: tetratricopeptide repeat protein, partial [Candidatus Zixiibacteriota bacterium]
EIGYRQGEASDLGNIGLIYKTKGEADEALEYLEQSLEIDREVGYRQGEANGLGNIGLVYEQKNELETALKYLTEALAVLDTHDLVYGRDVIERGIARIKKKMGGDSQ